MRRLRLFLAGVLAFVIALNASILPTPAIPPIIRPPSAELPSAIADDFIISQQTPYSSGRNEVVVTSPSTDMVQRFWLSLPGEPFQLYELALSNIAVNNANSLISSVEAQTTPAKVQQRLKNFKAVFDNNALAEIELADGTKAIFSPQEVTIMQPDGRVAEVIKRRQSRSEPNPVAGSVWQKKSGQQIAKSNSCEKNTAREIALKSTNIKAWSTDIAAGWSPNIDWQDALATRLIREAAAALASTLQEATSSSVSLQKTTCKAPVQCGFRRDTQKEGISGNQVITDLFKVPTGATGEFNLDYEFFTVPDRLEISYNGEIKHAFGPTDGDGSQSFSLADVKQGFVGIRVIGNPDDDTEWWYEINCNAQPSILAIDKWWATKGAQRLDVTLDIEVYEESEYRLDVDIENLNTWDLTSRAQFIVDGNKAVDVGVAGAANIGVLTAGVHKVKIKSFKVPDAAVVEEVVFHISEASSPYSRISATFETDDYLSAFFVADHPPNERREYRVAGRENALGGVEELINYYARCTAFYARRSTVPLQCISSF